MVIGTPTVLNLIPGGVMKVIHVNQVNENIEIQFRIMNGAQPFNVPEGVSCTIRGTKGDNFGYAADVAVTAGSNIVTVTLTEQLTAVAGAGNIFELVFVGASDDMKVSTENFLLDVERAALGEDTVISDSDLAYADQVLDQLQSVGAVNAQVQQNKANIAAEITRATAAEQTLQQNINAEAAARQAEDNTLQSNINAEASSRATTDASLQSQINQLVAPSGEAPSAAEVENARIGSDGTVYPTLGDAIRTQNSLLKSQLEANVNYMSKITTGYQGAFGGAAQGSNLSAITFTTASNRIRTFTKAGSAIALSDLIKLEPNTTYKVSAVSGYKYAMQLWNASGIAQLVFALKTDATVFTTTEAVYFGASLALTTDASIAPSAINNLKLELWNDLKNGVSILQANVTGLQADVEELQEEIDAGNEQTIPFTYDIDVKVFKTSSGYVTNFKPQSGYNTAVSGITVFISPDGLDTNDGLTISTPKKTIESCLSVSNVSTVVFLPGTYTVGTHFTAGLTISQPINFIGIGDNVTIDSGTGNPITFADDVYCEKITFKGGNNAVIVQQSSATKHSTFYRCTFANSYRLNGLAIMGGIAHVVQCKAHGNAYDGFNYHANGSITATALEVDCEAYDNGTINLDGTEGQSSNATTSHDGCPVVRVNGQYYACHGGIVADKDCSSANYGCSAGVSTITSDTYPDRKSNYWSSGANMYLYDCISYGTKYDTAKIRSGTITSDITYPSNYSA